MSSWKIVFKLKSKRKKLKKQKKNWTKWKQKNLDKKFNEPQHNWQVVYEGRVKINK